MWIQVDCDKLCMYNVIPNEINYRAIHSKLLVNQMKLY